MKSFKNIYIMKRFHSIQCLIKKPKHLICFKNWTSNMIMDVLESALQLKCCLRDTHRKRLEILANSKVMILQEVNEPFLNMAVSKAATLLGAYDVNITDNLVWEQDYMGRIFSYMADAIFVATRTHMCVQRFAEQSSVPVLCMRSRTHASIQALSTIMSIILHSHAGENTYWYLVVVCANPSWWIPPTSHNYIILPNSKYLVLLCSDWNGELGSVKKEEFGSLRNLNFAYCGSPHPVLNSYLLLCPMLGANIRFKCCCQKCPVSPLLFKASEDIASQTHTGLKECSSKEQVLKDAGVIIAGPSNVKKVDEFKLRVTDIESHTKCKWLFFHTIPRGSEVSDNLFHHENSRTFDAFENFQYIAAALMCYVIKDHKF